MKSAASTRRGTYLLFTDADVHLAGNTLRRAVSYMEARCLDHLVAAPRLHAPTLGLKLFLPMYLLGFYAGFKLAGGRSEQQSLCRFPAPSIWSGAETCRESNALAKLPCAPTRPEAGPGCSRLTEPNREALVGVGAVAVEWV